MADDRMRLAAEVTDGFTGPLGKLQSALSATGARARQVGSDIRKDFEGVHGAVGKVTGALGNVTPVLTQFGIGMLGAVTSVAGLSAALRGFTGNTQAMSLMSRETGTTIDRLRAFGELGERFGVSTQTMQGAVRTFASNMYDLRRRFGETYEALLKNTDTRALAEGLVNAKDMDSAIRIAMEGLGKISNPEKRRRVAMAIFGTEDIGAIAGELGGEFEKVMSDIARRMGRTTQEQVEAAKRFERSLSELKASAEGLTREAIAPMVDKLNEFLAALSNPEGVAGFRRELESISGFAGTTVKELKAIIDIYEKAKEYMQVGKGPADDRGVGGRLRESFLGDWFGGDKPTGLQSPEQIERILKRKQAEFTFNEDLPGGGQRLADKQKELANEIRRLTEALQRAREQGSATIQQQSYGGPFGGVAGLIHKAGYGSGSLPGYGGGGYPVGGGGGHGGGGYSGSTGGGAGGAPGGSGGGRYSGSGTGRLSGDGSGQEAPSSPPGIGPGLIPLPPSRPAIKPPSQPGGSLSGPGGGRMNAREPEGAGRYRPQYNLSDADLDQRVINTIVGEVSTKNPEGVDAVINNMLNRVGTKGWGPSRNLLEVARAKGQYAGYEPRTTAAQTEFVRSRIRAIASGGVPDNTMGSNSYRAEYYYRQTKGRGKGYWAGRAQIGPNVGGNRYAFEPGFPNGPYAPYDPNAIANRPGDEFRKFLQEKAKDQALGTAEGETQKEHGRTTVDFLNRHLGGEIWTGDQEDSYGRRQMEGRQTLLANEFQPEQFLGVQELKDIYGPPRAQGSSFDALYGNASKEARVAKPTLLEQSLKEGTKGSTPRADAVGDRLMKRMYGDDAPGARSAPAISPSKGSLDITLNGFPAGARARASMDDLFKETNVRRTKSQMEMQSI